MLLVEHTSRSGLGMAASRVEKNDCYHPLLHFGELQLVAYTVLYMNGQEDGKYEMHLFRALAYEPNITSTNLK